MTTQPAQSAKLAYTTPMGMMYVGQSETALRSTALTRHRGQVQLVFGSPPFPLIREKKYGNRRGQEFADWLAGFAPLLADYLTPDGSIVLELGNGWEPGQPTQSTAGLRALLAFQEAANLHLCQEFICYNPARLPSPAEWVTIRRMRVKDAFTRVWWMSPNPMPKADNRQVLTEYSASMQRLLKKGTYTGGKRPSQHQISEQSFLTNHGGAIPPNVLVPPEEEMSLSVLPIPNTASRDPFPKQCKEQGFTPHPARMPPSLVRFFVSFLTDPGDKVLDPFAGSNTTGWVAEAMNRAWIGIEENEQYALSSQLRFARLLSKTVNDTDVQTTAKEKAA